MIEQCAGSVIGADDVAFEAAHALARQPIDRGRVREAEAVASESIGARRVDRDDQDVGPMLALARPQRHQRDRDAGRHREPASSGDESARSQERGAAAAHAGASGRIMYVVLALAASFPPAHTSTSAYALRRLERRTDASAVTTPETIGSR